MRERSREHPEKLVGWLVGGEISWGVTSGSDGRAARRGLRVKGNLIPLVPWMRDAKLGR